MLSNRDLNYQIYEIFMSNYYVGGEGGYFWQVVRKHISNSALEDFKWYFMCQIFILSED